MAGKRTQGIWFILLLVLVLGLLVAGCGQQEEEVAETEISVYAEPATLRDLAQVISYTGFIRGKEEAQVEPKIGARVTQIHVKPGDVVRTGQTLITLDSSDFVAGVRQAEAAVATAQAGLERAQTGQVSQQVNLDLARTNLERLQSLYEAGGVSQREVEEAQRQVDLLQTGELEASIAQARSQVAQAQAGLQQARNQLNNSVIKAPINGVVGSLNLSLGEMARPGMAALVISDMSALELEVFVSESDISHIIPGSEVQVMIQAASEQFYAGRVEHIGSVADPARRNFPVKITLANPGGVIRSGMFGEVRIFSQTRTGVLSVPIAAVIPRGGQQVVFVHEDNRARQLEVETGMVNTEYVEIIRGLEPGQQVITRGNTLLNDGSLIRVISGGAS